MKKNGWIVILVMLLAFLLPAAGMQIALHGKTVISDESWQENEDGIQKNEPDGLQTDEAGSEADRLPESQETGQNTETGQREESDYLSEVTPAPVTEEQKTYFLTLEAACSDRLPDGTEVRLLATDRACGSSYYTLIGVKDGECTFVNTDPFLGSGGEALFITFPDQGSEEESEGKEERKLTGYAGLAYSGGSLGSLYMTQDGGRHFEELKISEPEIMLSDGTTYCPFIMPEEVYEENGEIYLVMGQGPDGDYHDGTGYPSGLYLAGEDGKTFRYVKSIYENRE